MSFGRLPIVLGAFLALSITSINAKAETTALGTAELECAEVFSGKAVLKVSGAIENTSDGAATYFDFGQLESLGTKEITTESPWTDGATSFQGVPVSALVDHLGAKGERARFLALDDYTVTIPVSDFEAFEPILATRRDGKPMKIRDKGPIWVIYPWSDYTELQNEENYSKAIWQVCKINFE